MEASAKEVVIHEKNRYWFQLLGCAGVEIALPDLRGGLSTAISRSEETPKSSLPRIDFIAIILP